MAVYVDDARIPWRGRRWSHLVADTADELHAAASALGIPRRRAHERGRTLHYDLPDEWRERAIASGVATPIEWRELVARRSSMARGERSRLGGGSGEHAEELSRVVHAADRSGRLRPRQKAAD